MHAGKVRIVTLWVVISLLFPFILVNRTTAWEPGDEAEVFGHTFEEEYWTNSSILIEGEEANASLTASYVHVEDFSAFLIAFNMITTPTDDIMIPYQLFGMRFLTPEENEVFIGAIFAFLLAHNDTYGDNDLPDVGNEDAWYVVPVKVKNFWQDVTSEVEAIPATKLGANHYRFGMRYINMTARIVSSTGGFLLTLALPVLTVLISEFVVEYDIWIDSTTGEVHAETIYTIGQVTRARWLGLIEDDPSNLISESMAISAVHYLSVFASKYNVTQSGSGNNIVPPTKTTLIDENITIKVGDSERAFDIGLGRSYALINESTTPWTTVSDSETALNTLLGARGGDFLLVAWQAPLSAWIFAHMAYGLSPHIRTRWNNVQHMANNVGTAFHNSQWWYGVTFPEWNGLRVEQDPEYVAYTNVIEETTTATTDGDGGAGPLIFVAVAALAIIAIVVLFMRRR